MSLGSPSSTYRTFTLKFMFAVTLEAEFASGEDHANLRSSE
jgi:hypothetical protein